MPWGNPAASNHASPSVRDRQRVCREQPRTSRSFEWLTIPKINVLSSWQTIASIGHLLPGEFLAPGPWSLDDNP